jgi:hypothetical protein
MRGPEPDAASQNKTQIARPNQKTEEKSTPCTRPRHSMLRLSSAASRTMLWRYSISGCRKGRQPECRTVRAANDPMYRSFNRSPARRWRERNTQNHALVHAIYETQPSNSLPIERQPSSFFRRVATGLLMSNTGQIASKLRSYLLSWP